MTLDKALDIFDADVALELERSRVVSITQFISPPNIKRRVFKSGNNVDIVLEKSESSQLGAYIY